MDNRRWVHDNFRSKCCNHERMGQCQLPKDLIAGGLVTSLHYTQCWLHLGSSPLTLLHLFQCPVEEYPATEHFAGDVPFIAGFYKTPLDVRKGMAFMNAQYQWKVSNVATRGNMGAAISKGGSYTWVVKKIIGEEVVRKLFNRPSYIASYFLNIKLQSKATKDRDLLIAEYLMAEEKTALIGFIAVTSGGCPQWLLPMMEILHCFMTGFWDVWNDNVEALMEDRWMLILKGEAMPMNNEQW
ncbi:hypothetical protein EDD85DRAFT_962926 [Armillaria nabsnona]|nr:hypothetical protein EDD85DRAFT_962926 [Armillaria nabsnona]